MTNLKHVGRLKNTGDRVVVIFRELVDDTGQTTDEDHALVIYPDRLQDRYHDRIMDLLESDRAQQTENFYEVLHARTFHDGNNMLTFLHKGGFLKKVQVDNVMLCPTNHDRFALRDHNENLKQQNPEAANRLTEYANEKGKKTQEQVHVKAEDFTPPQNQSQSSEDATPAEQAKSLLAQAHIMKEERKMLDREIEKKEQRAYELDPSLSSDEEKAG